MNRIKALAISSCLALLAVAFLPGVKADEWNKKTILTLKEPVAIPGKVLEPGKYVMRLLDSQANRHVVQIFNEDESQVQATILAIPNYRLQPTDQTQFGFWEMPAGQPRALKAWFYPGDNFGQEFAYPKDIATTIARTNNENVPTGSVEDKGPISETTPSGETAAPQPEQQSAQESASTAPVQPPPPAETRTDESNNAQQNQNTQMAQNQPAPSTGMEDHNADQNAAQANTQPAQPPAHNLPRTASPFPLVGLAGLFSLGAAIAVRVIAKQSA